MSPSDPYEELVANVNAQYPNTKIIGYPYNIASEEATLALIDDVLNSWGRLDIWTSSTGLLGSPSMPTPAPRPMHNAR